MEFEGDWLETGRVTGALVQCPKLCQYISQIVENESQALSGRDLFQQFVEEKPPDNVQFQQLLLIFFAVHRGNGSEDGNETGQLCNDTVIFKR